MTRILVTGGLGFVGHRLTKSLAAEGNSVLVIDNLFSSGAKENLDSIKNLHNVEVHLGAIEDESFVSDVLKNGIDMVVHLAAVSRVRDSVEDTRICYETNVGGTFQLLKAAAKNRVNRFIFASSLYVFGDAIYLPVDERHPMNPKSPYAYSKFLGENMCGWFRKFSDINPVITRFFMVYGPSDYGRFIPICLDKISKGEAITMNGGEQILDFIYVDDVVDALSLMLKKDRIEGEYNIGSGLGTNVTDLVGKLSAKVGKQAKINLASARPFDSNLLVCDNSKAKRDLGFSPKHDLDHGLSMTVKAYLREHASQRPS
jgi:UDP-glucose 4-epimerase